MEDTSCSRARRESAAPLHRAVHDIPPRDGVGDHGEADLSGAVETDARLEGTE